MMLTDENFSTGIMSSRKLQKEIESTFKKINEGLDSFNYHYDRIQDLNNQVLDRNLESQKDKLETDLKREIKKLQKHREMIKNWQSNETIEAVVDRSKLNENRKLVEYAMEKYKEVEKNSKMKTFSNQSIMMASLETNDLTPLAIEMIEFLHESKEQLNEQIEALEAEYEKISSKRSKKNSSHESEKMELENFLSIDRFHLENFDNIIDHLKSNQIDPELVEKIKEDIIFIIESNQDPDFINDDTLYDEINQQAESNFKYKPKDENDGILVNPETASVNTSANSTNNNTASSTAPSTAPPSSSAQVPPSSTPGSRVVSSSQTKKSKSPSPSTPKKSDKIDVSSPDIVHKLKPASTPAKVGEITWSSIAASSINGTSQSPVSNSSSAPTSAVPNNAVTTVISSETDSTTPIQQSSSKESNISSQDQVVLDSEFSSVFEQSELSNHEKSLFSDDSMVKLPPGIQNLIFSFTAANGSHQLLKPSNNNTLCGKTLMSTISKPYLPSAVQGSYLNYQGSKYKNQIDLSKYAWKWNSIRGNNEFEQLIEEINGLSASQSDWKQINILTSTLFFGFYYGITPLENLLAEKYLFQLGWRPYNIKQSTDKYNVERFEYWFKNINESDYQVFDLKSWDFQIKFGFKLDYNLVEMDGIKFLA
ncbi:general negative regulator of transcription subunit 5 [[Candida] jaroonii]|uniref:General negative regulator of transcription subunit 5 n=1 Tax=[Candida] jaroonii TaxID=467808 RepID=A0ACA9Y3V2_9ASCO|nr:general negative regulator of transcription subunit 5 [[Candida] jaroonii]